MKKFYKKSLFLYFATLLCYLSAFGQTITVSGTIRDGVDNATMPGVTISTKDKKRSTLSDNNGQYNLRELKPGDIIVFSFIGYQSQIIPVSSVKKGKLDITLESRTTNIDEVVIVGYGSMKKSELTGSIGVIKADQIDQFSGGSIETSLQGKIAGLQVTTSSGEPGAAANITLRGVSSVGGASEPLYIIDGVPVSNDPFATAPDNANFSPLADLNPSDIESIEVLKDAASASIYGSRASNGVILITTKHGSSAAATVNVSLNSSLVDITRKIGVLNGPQFRAAYTDAIFNEDGVNTTNAYIIDSLHSYYRGSTDWQSLVYRKAFQYKADIGVSGASKDKSVDYYVNSGYRDLKPVVYNTNYKQEFGTARVNYKLSKLVNGSTNFNISNYNYARINNGIINRYITVLPVYSPYDPITGGLINVFPGGRINPLAQLTYETNTISRINYLITQKLALHISNGPTFQSTVSYDYSNTSLNYFSPTILTAGTTSTARGTTNYGQSASFINENTLTYNKQLTKKQKVDFLLGESFQFFINKQLTLNGINPLDNTVTSVGGYGSITSFPQNNIQSDLLSYFGRVNYNYGEKYLLSALVRADGSSRFGTNNRIGYFPAISGAWRFGEESFMKQAKWLSSGKLRIGYGITGNQNIGNYSSQGTYSKGNTYFVQTSIIGNSLANPNLKWEKTTQLDAGVDLEFFKGRVSLTADYYIKNTSDLLFNVQLPSQTGYANIAYNFGSLSNKGVDFSLSTVNFDKRFYWSTNLTFGLNRNVVTSLPDNQDYNPNNYSIARVGQPVGVFYGYVAKGVYATDADNIYQVVNGTTIPYRKGSAVGPAYKGGDVIFQDTNGDGVINDDDQVVIGNPTPSFFGGVQNTFRYKNFNLSFFINYVIGNQIFNAVYKTVDAGVFDTNFTTAVLSRWRNQGDVTDVPKQIKGDPMLNYATSTRFVEDGSFIRLQNITLGYTIPGKVANHFGVRSMNFGLSVQNLLTFGSYSGYDPEVSSGSDPLSYGVDSGAFPRKTSYNLSLNFKF